MLFYTAFPVSMPLDGPVCFTGIPYTIFVQGVSTLKTAFLQKNREMRDAYFK
jgi:hypothetical protein